MKKYCLDTGALIEPWNKHYSPSLCPEYWDILDDLAKEDIVFCTMEVKKEIAKEDDGLKKWVNARPYLFREVTEKVNENMRKIMHSHRELVDDKKGRSLADPWVVAHALTEQAVVVTTETSAPRQIKIPDVCAAYGVPWILEHQFAGDIGIKFTAAMR